jgi:hypothetical protein
VRAKQLVNSCSSRIREFIAICVLFAGFLFVNPPARAQNSSQTTITGAVVLYSKNSMIVKVEEQYKLFVFDRETVKPASLSKGTWVRVISTQTDDPEVRRATVVQLAPTTETSPLTSNQPEIVPSHLSVAQRAIEREARKFHLGVQGGLGMDPEVIDVGLLAAFGPFFTKNFQFRPNVDFAWGEITKVFAINGDFIYNMRDNLGTRRWFYFGAGPQFNFAERSASGQGVSFSDFHYSNALNVIVGMRLRNGVFTEIKTSVYAAPSPIFRFLVGYTF